MDDMIGKQLGNYQIVGELGRGGMAVVYRAFQPSLNRYVAIKVLPPHLGFDKEFVERFQREALASAQLRHPNIVVIHDVGHQQGIYFIVMELLEGRTLKQIIEEEGALSVERANRIVEQLAAALDYAHQQGLVHRDVKPANIFVGKDDHTTLTDFGIAKAASEAQQLTRTGMLMGTPEYMSPEQAEGERVDYRTDLYALGVVLYQMLVGQVPFRGTTPHAILHAVIYDPPAPLRQIRQDMSPAIETVVLKAIDKQPERRYQSGAELTEALGESIDQPGSAIRRPGASRPLTRSPQQTRRACRFKETIVWIVAAMAVILCGLLAVLAIMIFDGGGPGETPLPPTTAVAFNTQTATPDGTSPSLTATAAAATTASATVATGTPEPATDTPEPPTDTPEPPTDTPEPPTNTPSPTATRTPTATPTPCAFSPQGYLPGSGRHTAMTLAVRSTRTPSSSRMPSSPSTMVTCSGARTMTMPTWYTKKAPNQGITRRSPACGPKAIPTIPVLHHHPPARFSRSVASEPSGATWVAQAPPSAGGCRKKLVSGRAMEIRWCTSFSTASSSAIATVPRRGWLMSSSAPARPSSGLGTSERHPELRTLRFSTTVSPDVSHDPQTPKREGSALPFSTLDRAYSLISASCS